MRTLDWTDVRSWKISHATGLLCWQWCGTKLWHRWLRAVPHTRWQQEWCNKKARNSPKTRSTEALKNKVQFVWRNAFCFITVVVTHTLRWDGGECFFFCCAPAKLPRECHSDFAFKSSKLFLTAVMQGVMHSKCLFDKFLSSGKNKSHICIGNSALLLGNDCEFTSYNWRDVEIPFKHFSMYDSISGKLFFLHGDAEICGKYTSETVLFKNLQSFNTNSLAA